MTGVINVSNSTQLLAALKAAKGGETIKLAGGDYGALGLTAKQYAAASTVTIMSADATKPAVFSAMKLTGVSNLKFDGVKFDYTYKAGQLDSYRPFEVNSSKNITIVNSVFDGANATGVGGVAEGYGTGYGLGIRWSDGVTIANTEFKDWLRGMVVSESKNLKITGNDVHDIRSDGMDFAEVQNVLIENNHIHDFRANPTSKDHRDMIQFWTTGTDKPSTDIVIRGNTLDIGDGRWTQSIFMRNGLVDTGAAGKEMYYQNVLIENNAIYNGHTHGITVGETTGLTIRDNSVIKVGDALLDTGTAIWTPAINVSTKSTGVSITGNVTPVINGANAAWVVKGNAFIQHSNPFAPGYYGDVFISSSLDPDKDGGHHFVARPGGMIDTLKAGSSLTELASVGATEALFTVKAGASGAERVFDASVTASRLGTLDASADYIWSFGDGTTASGKVVKHAFTGKGDFDVTLKVVLPGGKVLTADSDVAVTGPTVVTYNAATGGFTGTGTGTVSAAAAIAAKAGTAGGLHLTPTGTVAAIPQKLLAPLRGADDFAISFTVDGDTKGGSGELFRFHQSFIASVTKAGGLKFQLFDSTGKSVTVTTAGAPVNDGAAHKIVVDLDDGLLKVLIDGTLRGQVKYAGSLPTSGSWDLAFGNPWSTPNFDGSITAFEVKVDEDLYPAKPASVVIVADKVVTGTTAAKTLAVPEAVETPEADAPAPALKTAPAVEGEDSGQLAPTGNLWQQAVAQPAATTGVAAKITASTFAPTQAPVESVQKLALPVQTPAVQVAPDTVNQIDTLAAVHAPATVATVAVRSSEAGLFVSKWVPVAAQHETGATLGISDRFDFLAQLTHDTDLLV